MSCTAYLDEFHSRHAGITEAVPRRARDQAGADLVAGSDSVLDLACGSTPLWGLLGRRHVGIDRSEGELALARDRCPHGRFVQGDAAELGKLADGRPASAASCVGCA